MQKRSLDMNGEDLSDTEVEKENDKANLAGAMAIEGQTLTDDTEVDEGKDRKKRTKKVGADSTSLGSAGSLEGSVRSQ
jgi:hypothetical protein